MYPKKPGKRFKEHPLSWKSSSSISFFVNICENKIEKPETFEHVL